MFFTLFMVLVGEHLTAGLLLTLFLLEIFTWIHFGYSSDYIVSLSHVDVTQ